MPKGYVRSGVVGLAAIVSAAGSFASCASSGSGDGDSAESGAEDATADSTTDGPAVSEAALPGMDAPTEGEAGPGPEAGPGDDAAREAGEDARGDARDDAHDAHDDATDGRVDDAAEAGRDAKEDAARDASRGDATEDSPADAPVEAPVDAPGEAAPDGGDGGDDGGTIPPPARGEVLITEVMYDPSTTEPNTEWFEVHSTVTSPRLLSGLVLRDGDGRTHTIASSPAVVLEAGAYAVLVRLTADCEAAKVPASAILYEYGAGLGSSSGILLANGTTGGITMLDASGSNVLAESPYGPWGLGANGKSIQLSTLTFAGESQKASWCESSKAWTTGADDGTPGAAADCP